MRICYVASASPWPAHFGGGMRTAGILAALERRAEVELLVVGDDPGAQARAWLSDRGATLWTAAPERRLGRAMRIVRAAVRGRSIPAARFCGGEFARALREVVADLRPDVVLLGDTVLGEAVPSLAGLGCRVVVDNHNVESSVWHDVGALASSPVARAGYGLLSANIASLERRVLPAADRVWTASEEDAAWYRSSLGLARVDVVPNVLDETADLGPPTDESTVILTGLFAYPPNEDAALQLLAASRELCARRIRHRLCLVGRPPSRRMRRAARGLDHVEITGAVDSIEPWMRRACVFAAPLRAGSGTKFKLLQAMLAGRALVTTATGARGLGLEHDRHALICDAGSFADGLAVLLGDPLRRGRLAADARTHVLQHFTRPRLDAAVGRALDALVRG